MTARLINTDDGLEVLPSVKVADTISARIFGLLGRRRMSDGEGLVIPRCSGIHTLFMRFGIGLIFVDDENVVVSVRREVKPWRIAVERDAHGVIECRAGSPALERVKPGDRLELVDT